ncbi:MAG: acyl-CoA dehydratase activase-related protein [Planctomycetota bacterium]
MRIGLLRNLLYWPLLPFWRRLFTTLGAEVVVSPEMTADLFDKSRRLFVGDICLPIESAFYHVDMIKHDVDVLFIPRANRIHEDLYVCPTCAGLPYMIEHLVAGLPTETLFINLSPFRFLDRSDMRRMKALGFSKAAVTRAYAEAVGEYDAFVARATAQPDLNLAMEPDGTAPGAPRDGRHILLLGMPYVLGDRFINHGVPDILRAAGCRLTTPYMLSADTADKEVVVNGYRIYWSFAGMTVSALVRALDGLDVDGVLYCSPFACGPDSLIVPIVQAVCKRHGRVPFCLLTLDEHAEATHIQVRIEAFLDCLDSRRRTDAGGVVNA